jgi:hypothetical protein
MDGGEGRIVVLHQQQKQNQLLVATPDGRLYQQNVPKSSRQKDKDHARSSQGLPVCVSAWGLDADQRRGHRSHINKSRLLIRACDD